jgi:hypothetical protein
MKTALLLFILTVSLSGISKAQQSHEYLTMTQAGNSIELCTDSQNLKDINVKDEKTTHTDYRPLLKRIQEYEKEGWEIVTNVIYFDGFVPYNYVLMRRKK